MRPSTWTKDYDNRIVKMLREGHSYKSIGDSMGVSKNAVAGRINRMGFGGERTYPPRSAPRRKVNKERPSVPLKADIEPLRVGIQQLKESSCRFIYGYPGTDTYYCGHETEHGQSYCPAHQKIVFKGRRKVIDIYDKAR